MLISNPANIHYLTGVRGVDGYLLITREGRLILFSNILNASQLKKNNIWELVISDFKNNIFHLISEKIARLKLKNTGFEAKHLPFLEYQTIRNDLSENNIKFIKTYDFLEKIRMFKTPSEVKLIKKSVAVSKEAFLFAEEIKDERMTEKHLAIEIEKFLKLKADSELAFEAIVACGKNSAFAHHRPQETKLSEGNLLIDLGSRYYGYCADLTRVFFCSKMPILFKEIFDTVKKAQELSISKIKDGARIADVDRAARQYIEKKGWGKNFTHGLGHGVGLSVHEPPYLRPNSDEVLKEGMVITVEPAIYIDNKFGVRIEDMVLVKGKTREVISCDGHR